MLYVQECVGSVNKLCCLSGFHILTFPSHEEDANVALDVRFQLQANASLECSWYVAIGNSGCKDVSYKRSDPSPDEVNTWFECTSL